MISRIRIHPFVPPLAALLTGAPGVAFSQELPLLEELVVTSTLREAPLASLPASASVLDASTLRSLGARHFEDVLGAVPNLNWAGGSNRPRYFQLRGVGELEQYQGAPNPSVGFLIDDIDFSGIGVPAVLFDVAQVEVLRGPQGTTYGANALAGLVSVRSAPATPERTLLAQAGVGDYGSSTAGIAAGGALPGGADGNAWRLAAHHERGDGFRRNAYLGRDDTNGLDETLVRGKLRLQVGEHGELGLTALYADMDDGYDAWAIDNSRVTQSDDPGRDAQRSLGGAARLDWAGFESFDVRALVSFADSRMDYAFDGDWGNDALWGADGPYDFTSQILRERRTASADLRASSRAPAQERAWTAGLYALQLDEELAQDDSLNGESYATSMRSDYRARNLAAYAQLEQPLATRLRLSVGLRGEQRRADYEDSNALRRSPVDTMLGGHASLSMQVGEHRDVYATLARGYKAGGFNIVGTPIPDERREYVPEYLWNLELGTHASAADGRWRARGALFYMRREHQQVYTSFQLDPGDPLTFVLLTDNVSGGENYGIEGELGWRLAPRWQLRASLAALGSRYLGTELGPALDGREQAHAPEYQYAFGVEFRSPRGPFALVELRGMDDFYFDTSHPERSTAYGLVNARLGFAAGRWSVAAWGRNLFDAAHGVRGFWFGNEPPDYVPERYVQAGEPRHFGVGVEYRF